VGPGWPDERSPFPLEERIATAASVGYTGFGVGHADLIAARGSIGYPSLRGLLARHRIRYVEVEMLNDWFTDGPRRTRSDQVRADLISAAAELGALHIKAGGATDMHVEWDRFVEDFHALCVEAHGAGTRIAFEPMPFSNVSDLAAGRRLVDEAGHEAGGLMLDLWHVRRARVNLAEIADLPQRYIFAVELDDADDTPIGDLITDTLNHRRLCGEGYQGPWGVEILSEQFRKLSLMLQAQRSYRTAVRELRNAMGATA
jgi:sugar phosphate isomerase/epimerase